MFVRFMKLGVVAVVGLGLSACAQFYDGGQSATSSGPAFNVELLSQYQRLAKLEADEQDWIDADFFSQRALQTAAGNAPDPQALEDRDIPEAHYGELVGARNMLTQALDDGARESKPVAAAKAQAGFDCWMQEAEENIQPEDIQACKDLFWEGMNVLLEEEPAPPPMEVAMGPWTVYFGFDQSDFDSNGQTEVEKAAASAAKLEGATILLTAHTDTSGSEQYNLDLSSRRAQAVVDALEALGVDRSSVTASAVGESDPAVATGDGVRNAANRRAEIRLVK